MLPLHVQWTDPTGSIVYRGGDFAEETWQYQALLEGVLFPAQYSTIQSVVLRNPACDYRLEAQLEGQSVTGNVQTYSNIRLYLTGDSAAQVQQVWPALGGGYEISFDQGITWTLFDSDHGLESDPSTWVALKGSAVALGAPDGQLGPFPPTNQAVLQLRLRVPFGVAQFGQYRLSLGIDLDVL